MKRAFSILVLSLLFLSGSLWGQENNGDIYLSYIKNEIYLQYGAPSLVEMTNKLGNDTYNGPNATKRYKGTGSSYSGIFALGYNRYLNPYFCVGIYIGSGESQVTAIDTDTGKETFTSKVKSTTTMANFGWSYYKNGIWDISCGAAAGMAFKHEDITAPASATPFIPKEGNKQVFAYNFTVLKVKVEEGALGCFAEFGFGYKGVANAGICFRF